MTYEPKNGPYAPASDECIERWQVQVDYGAKIVVGPILRDELGAILARLAASEREFVECRDLLHRVLDSIAIPANDEIYLSEPGTVRDVLLDEVGQECERMLGEAGKPCRARWEATGYDVEWEDDFSLSSAPVLCDQPPAYAIRPRGSMGMVVALARIDSVAGVDVWIADQQAKEQKP